MADQIDYKGFTLEVQGREGRWLCLIDPAALVNGNSITRTIFYPTREETIAEARKALDRSSPFS